MKKNRLSFLGCAVLAAMAAGGGPVAVGAAPLTRYPIQAGGQEIQLDARSGVDGALLVERWREARFGERVNPALFAGAQTDVQRTAQLVRACVDLLAEAKRQEREVAKTIFKEPWEREIPDPSVPAAVSAAGRKNIEALQRKEFTLNTIIRDGMLELYARGLPKDEVKELEDYRRRALAGIVEHPKARP